MSPGRVATWCLLLLLAPAAIAADVAAMRIVTLAPHLGELVFEAGGGETLVGVVEHSDHPPDIQQLPRVGDAFRVDRERIASLQPDLILAWGGGTPQAVIEQLVADGYRVEVLHASAPEDVATMLVQIGRLTGHLAHAQERAQAYMNALMAIRRRYEDRRTFSVFVQIAERPLYTVNRQQMIGKVVEFCGGENVFGDLPELAAVVSQEAVVAADPAVILAVEVPGGDPLSAWRRFPTLKAVRDGRLHVVDANLLARPTSRLSQGVRDVCAALQDPP